MSELKNLFGKSDVSGLNNSKIDALDRYFFQIVPSILTNEIHVSMSYRYYNLTKGTLDKARNILNRRAVVKG